MIRGIRKKADLAALNLSRVLQARVGALLSEGVEVTATVLEMATPGTSFEKLLLDPRLLRESVDAELVNACAATHGVDEISLTVVETDGRHVIALDEERLADGAWEDNENEIEKAQRDAGAGEAPATAPSEASGENLPAPVAPMKQAQTAGVQLASSLPAGASAQAGGVFSAVGIERLELLALTSSDLNEKITALRQLAYAPLAAEAKGRVFLHALNDGEPDVRAEAAKLLVALGLDRDVAEDIDLLEHGQAREKNFAVGRLAKHLLRGKDLDVAVGLIVLMRRLRDEQNVAVQHRILEAFEAAVEAIASGGAGEAQPADDAGAFASDVLLAGMNGPARAAELIKLLISLLASKPAALHGAISRLCGKLAHAVPDILRPALEQQLEDTDDRRVRLFLLLALADIVDTPERRSQLAEQMAAEIARRENEGMPSGERLDFRALGAVLMEMSREGVRTLVNIFPRAAPTQQPFILRLLGDICRFRDKHVTPAEKNDVGRLYLAVLTGAPFEVRKAVMDSVLPADRDLSDELRAQLADALMDNVIDLSYATDVENVETTISRMGLPALPRLLERLRDAHPTAVRSRAARVLGKLGRLEGDRDDLTDAERAELEECLRKLQQLSYDTTAVKGDVLVAIAEIASARFAPPELTNRVCRSLLKRQNEADVGPQILYALGWVISGPQSQPARIRRVVGIFRGLLADEGPEFETEAVDVDGEQIFQLGPEVEYYTDVVPACLEGLRRATQGRATPKPLREELTRFLLDRWTAHLAGRLSWGPANIGYLVDALKAAAIYRRTSETDRTAIVMALGGRMDQEVTIEAVGEIFERVDKPGTLATLASAAIVKLLARRGDRGQFRETEREVILHSLARMVGRKHLATSSRQFKNLRGIVIDLLFDGLKDSVPGCYDRLLALRDSEKATAEIRNQVTQRLQAYHAVALR